jgi:hypothetical protein
VAILLGGVQARFLVTPAVAQVNIRLLIQGEARMRRAIALISMVMTSMFAAPALADETWTARNVGQIVWETDIGDTSVFSYQAQSGRTVKMYVEGLPSNISNRQTLAGYWMIAGDPVGSGLCNVALTAADGATSATWGHFQMRFARRTFPTGWTATMTDCFAGPRTTMRARPNVGN